MPATRLEDVNAPPSDFVTVPFCIPNELAERLRAIVARGTLGTTLDDVVNHMVRQFCFEVDELVWRNGLRLVEAGERAAARPVKARPFPKKVPGRAAGGKARAAKLTPAQRSAIAKKGGIAKKKIAERAHVVTREAGYLNKRSRK